MKKSQTKTEIITKLKSTGKKIAKKPKKTPRTRKPAEMSLEEWQIRLRREYGREQNFDLKNLGSEPIFSEFLVKNPETGGAYRVAIRGQDLGENYCSCPDFRINTLGTCKHIEFTLAKLEHKRGAKKAFEEGFHPTYSELYLHYGSHRELRFKPGIECPEELLKYASRYFDEKGALKPKAISRFHTFVSNAPKNGHELRCYEDALQFAAQLRDGEQRRKQIEKRFPKGISSPQFRNLLNVELYPYQRKGALFAAKAGRCLIGDDMGLGKTIQAIAAVEILAQTAGIERVLVVGPTSLKHQWQQEIERFTSRSIHVVEGLRTKRRAAYQLDSFYKIINYDVIHNDLDLIEEWAPDIIILDEAQRIKNWKTRRAQCVKRLQSEYAIVLTGTPLENRLEELHSIVEFVDRYRLGPLFRFLSNHQKVDDVGKVVGYHNLSQIGKTLEPILIRRTKDEVLQELPERVDQQHFVPMTDEQWNHHAENQLIVARIVHKWRRLGFLTEKDQRRLMIALQNMRMSCNSTFLLDKNSDHGIKADEFLVLLQELLEEPETKIVVFSQWLGTHQVIIDRLDPLKLDYIFYHGGVPGPKRKDLIQRFRDDPTCRIFLSTDAGGVGLNLQCASVVVVMDQPWNPAVLEQRIGRVHRLGQKRNVRVVHYIAQGTIEHGMLEVLKFKKSMFAGVLDGGEDQVFLGESKLNKFMETVEKVTSSIPESMPHQETATPDSKDEETIPETMELIGEETPPPTTPKPAEGGWEELISTGVEFFSKLGQALQTAQSPPEKGKPSKKTGSKESDPFSDMIVKDKKTGQTYLKAPLPEPDTLQKIASALSPLFDALQNLGGKK